MKNITEYRQLVNLSLGFDSELTEIPLDIPCHAYAIGFPYNYCIGDLLSATVDSNTSDVELIHILSKELQLLNLRLIDVDYSNISEIILTKRVIQITRMATPCRDYHFYLYHSDGTFSHKFRNSEPQYFSKIELIRGEYSLGIYSVELAL